MHTYHTYNEEAIDMATKAPKLSIAIGTRESLGENSEYSEVVLRASALARAAYVPSRGRRCHDGRLRWICHRPRSDHMIT